MVIKNISLVCLSLILVSCQTGERSSFEVKVDRVPSIGKEGGSQEKEKAQISSEEMNVDVSGQQLLSIIPNGENLRIGLILGPGTLRSFAHVGVLKAFEEAKVPVTAVVGLEWGSLVAALYARKGEAFDVEWQMLKLKKSQLPSSGLLSSRIKRQSVDELENYFKDIFIDERAESSQVFFACPSRVLSQSSVVLWQEKGKYQQILKSCLSYQPYYKPYKGQVAGAFFLKHAVDRLKKAGTNRIFFVNVLSGHGLLESSEVKDDFVTQLLWQQGEELLSFQKKSVDEYLSIDMEGFSLLNYDRRREMIERGYQSGKNFIEQMTRKYGF